MSYARDRQLEDRFDHLHDEGQIRFCMSAARVGGRWRYRTRQQLEQSSAWQRQKSGERCSTCAFWDQLAGQLQVNSQSLGGFCRIHEYCSGEGQWCPNFERRDGGQQEAGEGGASIG